MSNLKRCSKCKRVLGLDEFTYQSNARDKRHSNCKICRYKAAKERRQRLALNGRCTRCGIQVYSGLTLCKTCMQKQVKANRSYTSRKQEYDIKMLEMQSRQIRNAI